MSHFECIVGNIGTVYSGSDSEAAHACYAEYVSQSQRNYGRAAGESVTLTLDDEIILEHEPQPHEPAEHPDLDEFFQAYVECALWSSTDENEEPLDGLYSADDIAPDSAASMRQDCADFLSENDALLTQAIALHPGAYSMAQAGHDFWLTRNRHGAGFWDRGLNAIGTQLTAAAHAYGSADLYLGDDELIHQA